MCGVVVELGKSDFRKIDMHRNRLISAIAVLAFGLALPPGGRAEEPRESPRPNVLLLLTDQQTLRAMSAYGNRHLHTPNMDSLAKAGVRFSISYCAAPVCGPARSSLVTGRMPHETGVNFNGDVPDPSIPNLGETFRKAGYETAWAGKWHLPASYPRAPRPKAGLAPGVHAPERPVSESPKTGQAPGIHAPEPVPFSERTPRATIPGFEYLPVPEGTGLTLGDQTDAAVTDQAIAFLNREHDRPWLLAVSLHNPHDICLWVRDEPVAPANLDLFPPLPDNFAIVPDEPQFMQDCRQPKTYGVEQQYTADWDAIQWRAYLYTYYRMTEQVDRCIGRVLNTLTERGLRQNTLIVFTSDHGEGAAEHQLIVKLTPYDGAASVPLVWSWPGAIAAGVEDAEHPVSAIDIVPTLCDFAGVPCPPVTGISLRPWIDGDQLPGTAVSREHIVCQLAPFRTHPQRQGRIVRTQRYKYVAFTDGARPEMLFDMQADPGETDNLAFQPEHAAEVARHRRLLADWTAQTRDAFAAPWMEF
jgi:arylsulfatase A-like enzyme